MGTIQTAARKVNWGQEKGVQEKVDHALLLLLF